MEVLKEPITNCRINKHIRWNRLKLSFKGWEGLREIVKGNYSGHEQRKRNGTQSFLRITSRPVRLQQGIPTGLWASVALQRAPGNVLGQSGL